MLLLCPIYAYGWCELCHGSTHTHWQTLSGRKFCQSHASEMVANKIAIFLSKQEAIVVKLAANPKYFTNRNYLQLLKDESGLTKEQIKDTLAKARHHGIPIPTSHDRHRFWLNQLLPNLLELVKHDRWKCRVSWRSGLAEALNCSVSDVSILIEQGRLQGHVIPSTRQRRENLKSWILSQNIRVPYLLQKSASEKLGIHISRGNCLVLLKEVYHSSQPAGQSDSTSPSLRDRVLLAFRDQTVWTVDELARHLNAWDIKIRRVLSSLIAEGLLVCFGRSFKSSRTGNSKQLGVKQYSLARGTSLSSETVDSGRADQVRQFILQHIQEHPQTIREIEKRTQICYMSLYTHLTEMVSQGLIAIQSNEHWIYQTVEGRGDLGLTKHEVRILKLLESNPQPLSVLAKKLKICRPKFNKTLQHLIRLGLVKKIPNPNRNPNLHYRTFMFYAIKSDSTACLSSGESLSSTPAIIS